MNNIYTLPLIFLLVLGFFPIKSLAQTSNLPGKALQFQVAGQYVSGTGINSAISFSTKIAPSVTP